MLLADLRDQIDLYGLRTALGYLNEKMTDKPAAKQLASNPVFAQVGEGQCSIARHLLPADSAGAQACCICSLAALLCRALLPPPRAFPPAGCCSSGSS